MASKPSRWLLAGLAIVLVLGIAGSGQAASIKVINSGVSGHGMVVAAISHLNALGHTVTTGGTLADYSAFDQVWDLRFNANLGAGDIAAMGAFLAAGGRMYLTGEHSLFDGSRNNSLISWITAVGGGTLTKIASPGIHSEAVTAAGQIVNTPNPLPSVSYNASRSTVVAGGNGFLVTEVSQGGAGSLVGWDFGDITGAAGARMLVGFDIEIFATGQNWTDNMATYLGNREVIPEPGTIALFAFGAVGIVVYRRRRRT